MLILPIVNRNRILNVEVKLKNADKIRTGVRFSDALESEVLVNGIRFSESSFSKEKDVRAVLEFIRTNSLRYKRNYLITTREEANSLAYDVYEVEQPPKKVCDCLDDMYVSVITDMRKEIPKNKRGRYLSFEKLGFLDILTDDKLDTLEGIVKTVKDSKEWMGLFENAGVSDLVSMLDFLKIFDCTVVEETTISEENLQTVVESLKKLNTRDSRNLVNYYNIALSNRDVYSRLSMVNKLVYDKPLTLIQSKKQKSKQLVKSMGDGSNGQAA